VAVPLLWDVPLVTQKRPPGTQVVLVARPISEGVFPVRASIASAISKEYHSAALLQAEVSVAEQPQKWISIASSTGTKIVPYLECASSHKKNREENLLPIKAKLVRTVYAVDESFVRCNIPLCLFLCYFKIWH